MPTHWSEALSQGSAVMYTQVRRQGLGPSQAGGSGNQPMVPPPALVSLSSESHVLRPEPGSLSEKVSHLESMLRKLQDDLQKVTRWLRVMGSHTGLPQERGQGLATLTPASLHLPPGEGRQGGPGGGGAEPATQQPAAAGRVRERGHPPAPGLQAAGLPHQRPGLKLSGPASAWPRTCWNCPVARSGHLGHTRPWALLRDYPCARRILALPPLPGPLFGGILVAKLPLYPIPVCKYSVEKRGLQGIKKPPLFVSTQVFMM